MQQYEVELEKKTSHISQMEAEQQHILQENSNLSQQLYLVKGKLQKYLGGAEGDENVNAGNIGMQDEKIQAIQRDQMVDLLKRNHDVLMEKYELFRKRNETLEKVALEKEKLYNEIKLSHD